MVNWPGAKARQKKKEHQEQSLAAASASASSSPVSAESHAKVVTNKDKQNESFMRAADMLQYPKDLDEELRISLAVLVGQNCLSFPAQLESRVGSDMAWARDLLREVVVDCFALPETLV
jgi:hypothetical protein